MPKVPVQTVENLENQPSALEAINASLTALQDAFDEVLFRTGEGALEDNHMVTDLDMNSRRIINLPPPEDPLEPARHGDIQQYVDAAQLAQQLAEAARDLAEQYRDDAEIAKDAAEVAQAASELALQIFQHIWRGVLEEEPEIDPDPEDPEDTHWDYQGSLYFNREEGSWYVYWVRPVVSDGLVVMSDGKEVVLAKWEVLPKGTVSDLLDTDIDNPVLDEFLQWNGLAWVNAALDLPDLPEEFVEELDDLDDVEITDPQEDEVLTYNGTTWVNAEPPAGNGGGGGEAAWELHDTWEHATDVSTVDFTDLEGANEILIVARGVTFSSSSHMRVRVSVNNGASFFTTGSDYIRLSAAGLESTQSYIARNAGDTTAARSMVAHIHNVGDGSTFSISQDQSLPAIFIGSDDKINAVQVRADFGNMTAGSIKVFKR